MSTEFDIHRHDARAPQQARSAETARRLMDATLALLRDGGLEACTVPAVAARAKVAVGTVYRRYRDKDQMVAAAILSLFGRFDRDGIAAIEDLVASAKDLEDVFFKLVLSTACTTIQNRTTFEAVREFARSSRDIAFLERFEALRGRPREAVVVAIWHRFEADIGGGEAALRLALAAVYGAVNTIYFERAPGLFTDPPEASEIARGLARMQAAYLLGSASHSL